MNGGNLNTSVTIDEDGLIIKGSRKLTFGSTAIDATANELNILDADTSASTPTLADADQMIINDGPENDETSCFIEIENLHGCSNTIAV